MRILALALSLLAAAPSPAATDTYRVLFAGEDRGHMIVETDGNEVQIDFDYKQNGRGPTIEERLVLDDAAYPLSWTITGTTTFGNQVDEWFRREDGVASWQDASGSGSTQVDGPAFYAEQNGSVYSAGLLARALLADADGTLEVLPGGTARIRAHGTMTFDGPAGKVEATTYEISGLSLNPSYVTLDADRELFAVASPNVIIVRQGYESADQPLREYVEQLGTERFVEIQSAAARRFDGPVRIRNVRIFDPAALALTAPSDVVVNGNTIASVQPAGSVVTPGETVIDGAGGTLVPGMYEMHGHIDQEDALLNVAAGVTSVRDMGNENAVLDGLIERIERGVIAGPRITRSGFIEGQSEFSAATGETVATLDEALALLRWYGARGYQQIKLYNSMKPEWAPRLVEEAHALGMRVSGHVPAFSTADAMIAAGFDEITHVNQLMLGWVLKPDEDTRTLFRFTAMQRFPDLDLDGPAVQATLDSMVKRGVAHDPTIGIHELGLTAVNGEVPPGSVDYIDHLPVNAQRNERQALFGTADEAERQRYVAAFGTIMQTLRMMHARGILLVPGTDRGGSFTYHRELELFRELGMTPAEVLRRATLDMAAYLGQEQRLGSIEKGKLADFFLVPGDPTRDLKAVKSIAMVVKDGTVYFPSDIYPYFGIEPFAPAPTVIAASD